MKIFKYFSVFAVVSTFAALGTACSGVDDTAQSDEDIKSGTYACKVDSDCVAISKGGCCPNGWNVAVNKKHVKSYEASHECHEQKICPLYVIDDTRVAECNTGTQKCEMVAIDDIACGGFTMNPHECPKGYTCELGHIPDIPGSCTAN